ncbi:iron-containing redox enzyme family protein [Kocuria sp. M1R5S2]|uniref:iron-containing redox enzyme family protein n=1 Tax=Kocuria rhizosphaerae TaxID=3376285 RepID=UPI0037A426D7
MMKTSTAAPGVGDAHTARGMPGPRPRGPFGEDLLAVLGDAPCSPGAESRACRLPAAARAAVSRSGDLLADEDVQLGLFALHALAHQGIQGVDDRWETHPELVRVRGILSDALEARLRAAVPADPVPGSPQAVADALFGIAADDDGPSLARHLSGRATAGQAREYLQLKSVYQLIEGDPHTWAIPRLSGRAKAGLIEIQVDEYGGGHAHRMHAALFAAAMREAGLDDTWGAAADRVPAAWLSGVNTVMMFGLQRRLRGASVGHLAMYEITSSGPSRFLARGFRRLGLPAAAAFYDEHVEADAAHEQIAARDMAGGLVVEDPAVAADVFFGARCVLHVDALAAGATLDRWAAGESALRAGSPAGARAGAAGLAP